MASHTSGGDGELLEDPEIQEAIWRAIQAGRRPADDLKGMGNEVSMLLQSLGRAPSTDP